MTSLNVYVFVENNKNSHRLMRIKNNCTMMNLTLVKDISLFHNSLNTDLLNSFIIYSLSDRIYFVKHAQKLHSYLHARKKKIVLNYSLEQLKQKHSLDDLMICAPVTWILKFLKSPIKLDYIFFEQEHIYFDADCTCMANTCNISELQLDFNGMFYAPCRTYPAIILTSCLQDFGKCEEFLSSFVNDQHSDTFTCQNILENKYVRAIFMLVFFIVIFALVSAVQKKYTC